MGALAAFAFVSGAVAGSFVSVVAHRIPRGDSIVGPRSNCPRCGNRIAAYDNIPIVSWLLLRGRCRSCGERISPTYPMVELTLGAAFVATVLVFADQPAELTLALVFVTMLAAVTITDLERRVIPNVVLAVGALIGAGLVSVAYPDALVEHGVAAAAAGGGLLMVAVAYPRGMGMGDVKLAAVMGLYLGRAVAPALLIAFAAGALVGTGLMLRYGTAARKRAIPFGPFLALGGLAALFVGDELVDGYIDTFAAG
jgi:leader peptidase (prepilin peptidase) / N-methyltransferase